MAGGREEGKEGVECVHLYRHGSLCAHSRAAVPPSARIACAHQPEHRATTFSILDPFMLRAEVVEAPHPRYELVLEADRLQLTPESADEVPLQPLLPPASTHTLAKNDKHEDA